MITVLSSALEFDPRWSKIVLLGVLLTAIHFDLAQRGMGVFVSPLILSLAIDGVWPFTTIVWSVFFLLRPVFALFAGEECHVSAPLSPLPRRLHASRWYDEEDRPVRAGTEITTVPPQPVRPWYARRPAPPLRTTTEGVSAEEFCRRHAAARRNSTTKTADDVEREAFDRLPCRIAGVVARIDLGVFFARSSTGTAYYVDVFSQRFSYDFPSTYSWPLTDPMAAPNHHNCTTTTLQPQPPQAAVASCPTIVSNPLNTCANTSKAADMVHEWLQHPANNIFNSFTGLTSAHFRNNKLLTPNTRMAFIGLGDKMGHVSSFYSTHWAHLVSVDKDEQVCSQLKWMGLRGPMFNQMLSVLYEELRAGRESMWRGTPVERAYMAMSEVEEKLPHWLE